MLPSPSTWWQPDYTWTSTVGGGGPPQPLQHCDLAFIVMTHHAASRRLRAAKDTWLKRASATNVTSNARRAARVLIMSDRDDARTGEQETAECPGHSYWAAQCRQFEGIKRLLVGRDLVEPTMSTMRACASTSRWSTEDPRTSTLPKWTLLVDDDSFVNVEHLLSYATQFDFTDALLIGHVLDTTFGPSKRSLSGGAGMLLSRGALVKLGCALLTKTMPLPPPRGVANDVHIVLWAKRLDIRILHSNLFWYASLPADARLIDAAAKRLGAARLHEPLSLSDYVASNTEEGLMRRQMFSAVIGTATAALDAQMLGAVVLHRVPPNLMRKLDGLLRELPRTARRRGRRPADA